MDRQPICGRAAELGALRETWGAVAAGWGPKLTIILAESGLGKTRLAQEFYAALAADMPGHWPADLGAEGNSLRVNPPPGDAGGPMPFLWWGLRLVDPLSPNSIGAGVLHGDYERYLRPRLAPFQHARRRKDRKSEALGVGKGLLLDIAVDVIPFGGLAKTLGEAGMDLHRIYRQDRADGGDAPPLHDRILDDLALVLDPEDGAGLPGAILIDDAQFSGHDPGLVAFLEALLMRAATGRWRLLILITHWEREWFEAAPGTVAGLLARRPVLPVQLVPLAPVADLSPMLDAALPGLAPDQRARILARADGNPRFLTEMILFAAGSQGLFEKRDPRGPLTPRGLERLMAESTGLHGLIASRLKASPAPVQEAVCLASLQGVEFLQSLLGITAEGLHADAGAVAAALGDAENPHAYVASLAPEVAAFAQRVYFEVAQKHLENCFDPDEAAEALKEGARNIARSPALASLEDGVRERFLTLAAGLFELADDPADAFIAAFALEQLTRRAFARNDGFAARALADRLDRLIERSGYSVLDEDLNWLRLIHQSALGPQARETEERVLARMLRLTGETHAELPEDDWAIRMRIRALAFAASHHLHHDEPQAAAAHLSEAVAIVTAWQAEEQGIADLETRLEVMHAQAYTLLQLGQPGPARDALEGKRPLVDWMESIAPGHPPIPLHRARIAQNLAEAALAMDDLPEAVARQQEAVARFQAIADSGEEDIGHDLLAALADLALMLGRAGRAAEAAGVVARALALARGYSWAASDPHTRPVLAVLLRRAAQDAHAAGRPDEALALASEALGLHGDWLPGVARPGGEAVVLHLLLARLYLDLGRGGEALPHALAAREAARDAAAATLLLAEIALAEVEQALGQFADSALSLEAAGRLAAGLEPLPGDLAARLAAVRAAQPRLH